MPTTIKLKNSVTTTNAPSSLAQGEVAINVTDKKVWVGNAATTPVQLLGTGADGSFTNLAYTGTLTGGTGVVNLGSGQFYKDASGNVGVGTASPSVKLDVIGGDFRINRGATNTVVTATLETNMSGSSSKNIINFRNAALSGNPMAAVEQFDDGTNVNGTLLFKTNNGGTNAEKMRITSAGNVGIGTSSPAAALDVRNNSVDSIFWGNTSASIRGVATYSGSNVVLGSGTVSSVAFQINGVDQMLLNTSGNVGIGTTTPSSRLHLQSSSAVYITFTDLGDGASTIGQNGTALTFGNDAATGSTERMRIDSSGRLLVGTTSASGSTSNTASAVAGLFSSISGSAINTTINVAADLITLPNNYGTILLTVKLNGVGSPADADSVAIISVNTSTASQTNLKTGAWAVISLSGLTIRATQNQFTGANISWTAIRIS
jgi:hypothetical protein